MMDDSLFECLPVEVLYQILDKLPIRTLSAVSQVCRGLYESCQDERLWSKEIIKFDKTRSEVAEHPQPLSSNGSIKPSPRLCHISVVYNGSMWIHGGHNTVPQTQVFSEVKKDLWRYRFDERKWEQVIVQNLPPKTEHSAVIYNDKLYLFGGYAGEFFTNSLYCYDFATGECSLVPQLGDIPEVRSAHVGVLYQNKMYIFGGWNGSVQNADLYSFEFETSKWTKIQYNGVGPSARCSHAAVVSEKAHSLFVFAGYGGKSQKYLNDLCQYNFDSGTWSIIEHTLPSPRSRMRMVEFQNKIYIYGGWNKNEHFNNLYQYDLDYPRWYEVNLALEKDEGKVGQHSMVVHNNILYIFAGYNSHLRCSTNDLYAYRLSKPY